jgi:hypothetical protein
VVRIEGVDGADQIRHAIDEAPADALEDFMTAELDATVARLLGRRRPTSSQRPSRRSS